MAEKLTELFAKRQELLKQGMGEISVATKCPGDLVFNLCLGCHHLVGKGRDKVGLGKHQTEQITIDGSCCWQPPLKSPRRNNFNRFHFHCLQLP